MQSHGAAATTSASWIQGRVSNGLSMSVDMTGGSVAPSAMCSMST